MNISKVYDSHEARKLGFYEDNESPAKEALPVKHLYMSYDHTGFEQAKLDSPDSEISNANDFSDVFEYLVNYATHDWILGLCHSFQIYDETGDCLFSFDKVRGVA